jgi:integrase
MTTQAKRSVGHVRPRGDKWVLKLELPRDPATGKRRARWETFESEKAARHALAIATKERDQGALVTNSRTTVREWCDSWLSEHARLEVSAASHERYRDALRHVTRHIGAVRLVALTAEQVQKVWVALICGYTHEGEQLKLSRVSAGLVRTVFTRVLKTAVRMRKVAGNVALDTTLPKAPTTEHDTEGEGAEPKAFTQAQVGRLLRGLQGDDLHVPVAIAAGTGLRRGEICALRWRDIEDGAVLVTGTIAGKIRKGPKTKTSRRRVPIAGELVAVIASYRARVAAQALQMGRRLEGDDLLFPARPDQPTIPQNPRAFGQRFERAARRLKIADGHFHRLRHYHATALLERGERVEVVADRLGHSSPAITLAVYANVLEEAKSKAAATAGAVLDEALAWAPAVLRAVK